MSKPVSKINTNFKRVVASYYKAYGFKIKQESPNDQSIISHMFPSAVKNIKNEEVKFLPTSSLTPSSSVTSFRSGKYSSLEELCNLNASSSTPIIELVFIKIYSKQLLFYYI